MNNILALRLLILISVITGLSCSKSNFNELRVIKFTDNYRTILSSSEIEEDASSFKIVYYHDYLIYEVSSTSYNVVKSEINGNNIVNKLYPSNDTTYVYFVIKKGEAQGLKYGSLAATKTTVFKMDSLENALGIFKENMKIFEVDLGKPKSIVNSSVKKNLRVERYFTKKYESDADSIYRYYDDNLIDIDFSFSNRLDKEKKSKLWRTDFIYLPKSVKNQKGELLKIPRTESLTFIEEIDIKYNRELMDLFKRFIKDRSRYLD